VILKAPHEYTLRAEQDEETFVRVVQTIWVVGYERPYLRRPWRLLDVGDHLIWVDTLPSRGRAAPLEITEFINRAPIFQDQLTYRGGS
jgi:hypothetical protein